MTWKIKKFAPKVTKAELHFFFSRYGLKSTGIRFITQEPAKGKSGRYYRVDGWVAPNILIEIDGATHDDPRQQEKDELRDQDLEAAGFIIVRFKNREVWRHLAACVRTVKKLYKEHGV